MPLSGLRLGGCLPRVSLRCPGLCTGWAFSPLLYQGGRFGCLGNIRVNKHYALQGKSMTEHAKVTIFTISLAGRYAYHAFCFALMRRTSSFSCRACLSCFHACLYTQGIEVVSHGIIRLDALKVRPCLLDSVQVLCTHVGTPFAVNSCRHDATGITGSFAAGI